jgi:hypothetical protein
MGERTASITVAECPDAFDVRGKPVIDRNKASLVDLNAGGFEPKVVRIQRAPGRDKNVAAGHDAGVPFHLDVVTGCGKGKVLRVRMDRDALCAHDPGDRFGDILVLARGEARAALDDGHFCAKATIHLGKFQGRYSCRRSPRDVGAAYPVE